MVFPRCGLHVVGILMCIVLGGVKEEGLGPWPYALSPLFLFAMRHRERWGSYP